LSELESETSDLIDYRKLKERTGFVLRSVGRHKVRALAVFGLVVAGAATALVALPRTYRVESRLLVQLDPLLPSVGEPGRPDTQASSPLRSARDTITARENLMALIRRADVLEEWPRHRAPALQVKDFVMRKLYGEVSEKDRLEALLNFLRKKLVVWEDAAGRPNEGAVNITVEWPDAQVAFRLVEAAQQGFIEARHVADMSAVAEASSLLETHAASWRAETVEATDDLRRAQASKRRKGVTPPPLTAAPAAGQPTAIQRERELPDPEAERLASLVAAKQRVITDLEDLKRRNLDDLQRRLAEQKAIYTDRHPYVISIRQSIDALSKESPQLVALREEAQALEAELMKHRSKPAAGPAAPVVAPVVAPIVPVEPLGRDEVEDPEVEAARARLKFALDKYQNLRARADSANLELEARRAAFKYRYTVVVPAELPKGPIKPNVPVLGTAAVLAGVMLAAAAAVLADVRAGRVVESWQVKHLLELPVIAEVSSR
jgi:hypothetical protein